MKKKNKSKDTVCCAKCGRTDKWMVGYNVVDKSTGKKRVAAICFACLAKLEDKGGEQ